MSHNSPEMTDEPGEFLFAEEDETPVAASGSAWKVLIADDEPDVHVATKLVLRDFSFKDRAIQFLDAYNGQETCEILRQNPDTAVVFLDVVMESDDAGLRAVKRIREELGNQMVRIILRTGQPGHAPEEHVVLNYHINDYKSKSEMTTKKLFTSLVSALRSFQDLQTIEASRRGLEKVLDAAGNMDFRSRNLFVSGLLLQLASLLDLGDTDLVLISRNDADGTDMIMAAAGGFDSFVGEAVKDVLDSETVDLVTKAFASGDTQTNSTRAVYLVPMPNLRDVAIYVGGSRRLSETELALVDIFCIKVVLAHENFEFVEQSRKDQSAEIALLAKITGHADYLTVAHAVNRGRLSREIAQKMKDRHASRVVEGRLPDLLERSAILADIGNIEIPSSILDSAQPLSADDQARVRAHTKTGAALLQNVLAEVSGGRVATLASEIALTHHECFDGSGYPQRLSGDAIPMAGRIVAVADTYLAMTSPRPWRGALAHEQAVALIDEESGKKFDPKVVDAFSAVVEAFRQAS